MFSAIKWIWDREYLIFKYLRIFIFFIKILNENCAYGLFTNYIIFFSGGLDSPSPPFHAKSLFGLPPSPLIMKNHFFPYPLPLIMKNHF